MLSPGEISLIEAEIERLEKARQEFTDAGILRSIDARIEEEKTKLESHDRLRRLTKSSK
jgi:hypothetical protein